MSAKLKQKIHRPVRPKPRREAQHKYFGVEIGERDRTAIDARIEALAKLAEEHKPLTLGGGT